MPSLKSLKNYLNNELDPFDFINESPDLDTATISGTVDRSIRDAVRDYNMYESVVQSAEVDAADVVDVSDTFAGDVVGVVGVLPDTDDVINILDVQGDQDQMRFPANFDELTGEFDANNSLINMVQQFDLFEQIESFFGLSFQWREEDNKIYFDNYDSDLDTFYITVVTTIDDTFDSTELKDINIEDPYAFGWIRRYAKAKMFERFGRLLATSETAKIDMDVGGSEIRDEGKDEQEKLLDELKNQQPLFS